MSSSGLGGLGGSHAAIGPGDPKKVAAARKKLEEYKVKKKNILKKDDKIDNNAAQLPHDNTSSITPPVDSNKIINDSSEIQHSSGPVVTQVNSFNLDNSLSSQFFDQLANNMQHQNSSVQSNENMQPSNLFFNNQDENNYNNGSNLGNDDQHFQQNYSTDKNASMNTNNKNYNDNKESAENDDYENDSIDEALSNSAVIKLQQQLQFHMQTVEFLVTEKQTLSSKVNELENMISDIRNQNIDLSGRLNISRQRASSLEVEYSSLKEKNESINNQLQQALSDNQKHKLFESSHEKTVADLKEELSETKSLVNIKLSENANLLKQIEELSFHLNANELRFQQLNQGNVLHQKDQVLENENAELKLQIINLNRELKDLDAEKNQSNSHYQHYVQQLNSQLESLSKKHEDLLQTNENLLNRESNLIQQMEMLEKQLQSTVHVTPIAEVSKVKNDDHSQISSQMQVVEEKNKILAEELDKKEKALQSALSEININKAQMDELQNTLSLIKSEQPDIVKLNAANESDRIAAQKATIQNSKLKQDIESLQEAYNKMTESKLELAELLQAEKNLSRKLTLALADNEEKLQTTNSKLVAKDEEMIRLQAESSELEKEALKHAQIMDRLNHYEVQNQSSDLLQQELEISKAKVKNLTEENHNLKNKLENICPSEKDNCDSVEPIISNGEEYMTQSEMKSEIVNDDSDKKIEKNKMTFSEGCLHIPTTEAMKKLQERFTRLMDDVANLSDDKQRLEHLVLQLQGETETICEYITLYQKQRSVLKQREYEKDIQLRLLSQERLQVQEQLSKLNALVQQLVKEHNVPKSTGDSVSKAVNGVQIESIDTADKIINLLTEIKSNHLSEPNNSFDYMENFHPCPWCSGKMITI